MNTRALSSSSSSSDSASSRTACGRGMVMTRVERTGSQVGRSSGPLQLQGQGHSPTSSVSSTGRPKSSSSSSSSSNSRRPTSSPSKTVKDNSSVSGRVRVAVRLRPRNAEELIADADFADCVELQPELKRLKLRKNNWDLETFQFDEVFTETASQKRVYEVVAKPVVESVLNGFNGTVMAYGQTGTGKTFTLGQLGEHDSAEQGIMVRALEDILADVDPNHDTVTVSYFQLYLETVRDLLAPERDNIAIVEDPKTGDVSMAGATMVQVRNRGGFVQLLKTGQQNRFASNTKMNTESSRSHAILLVCIKKSVKEKKESELPLPNENGNSLDLSKGHRMPSIRKSKLLIVDLAGSERTNKSGSEGQTLEEAKSINLSLTALGKCINALAENSSHIPIRDSKLTRLLHDSFGGSARTSLVITVGPSPRHRGETASTIMFGQRAMKVENMVKLREEFDYKSLCHELEIQVDVLIMENERQSKVALDAKQEMEKKIKEMQWSLMEAEKNLVTNIEAMAAEKLRFQKEFEEVVSQLEEEHAHIESMAKRIENLEALCKEKEKELQAEQKRHQDELDTMSQSYLQEIVELRIKLEAECIENQGLERELSSAKQTLHERNAKVNGRDQREILELRKNLEKHIFYQESLEKELQMLRIEKEETSISKAKDHEEIQDTRHKLKDEQQHRCMLEDKVKSLKQQISQLSFTVNQNRESVDKQNSGKASTGSEGTITLLKLSQMRDTISGQRATIAKIFEEVGLQNILSLLESEEVDVQIHAVKVVANLAAEEVNQQKIVEAGGLTSLLMLLETSGDETIQRVSAGAVANLAMNEKNQERIMKQGGIKLLAGIANKAEDPQTLRMVAGAIANLCGNDKLQMRLRDEGGIKALLGMVRSRHSDVLGQVARGVANFAKCESRGATEGHRKRRSLLIDDGALPWIVANSNSEATPIKRHIELALCHLAQHEANARDLVVCGALWELVRISRECSREDIRNLCKQTLSTSSVFQMELKKMHLLEDDNIL